jgi:transcriptional regulator with PAS, ATPase and Fis domain
MLVVTEDAELLELFAEASAEALGWRIVAPASFDFAGSAYNLALIDMRAFKPGAAELVLSRRIAGERTSEQSARFDTEVYPRSKFSALLRAAAGKKLPSDGVSRLLGESEPMRAVRAHVARVARFRSVPVMILGETGSGKEVVARAVHEATASHGELTGEFVAVNCAAVPENLFEAELFGATSGAFTGASKGGRAGLLEHAAHGTIFLDEIGDMPHPLQPKLLRALEERAFRRLGSNEPTPLTARVVSATHRSASQSHVLRRDLFYRLSGFTITLPPLRDRLEDLPILCEAFLIEFCLRHALPTRRLTREAIPLLGAYRWPGNLRELRSVVERAALLSDKAELDEVAVREALEQVKSQLSDAERQRTPRHEASQGAADAPQGRAPATTSDMATTTTSAGGATKTTPVGRGQTMRIPSPPAGQRVPHFQPPPPAPTGLQGVDTNRRSGTQPLPLETLQAAVAQADAVAAARRDPSEVTSPQGSAPPEPAPPTPASDPPAAENAPVRIPGGKTLRELERMLTVEAFEESGRNLSKTAVALGLPRSTVRDRLRRYGVL